MNAEGVVKYHAERIDGEIPDCAGFEALNRCRTALFDLGLIGVYPNGIGYGNVSLRTAGERFIISGSATGALRVLSREHYAWVESFDFARNRVRSVGRIQASSESMSHGAVYRARPTVRAVLHIHSRALFDALRARRWPETDPAFAFGTPELAVEIGRLVTALDADDGLFVTAGHDEGLIAYGASVEAALAQIRAVLTEGTTA